MIVSVAGAAVAAAVAAALPAALGAGLAPPPVVVPPPQAAMTTLAMRPSVTMVRCIRFPPLDVDFSDRVGTPADQTVFEPGEDDLGGERDDREDEHRREDAVRVERRLRGRDDETDPVDRAEVLADDGADQRETEARVETREDPGKRGREDHVRRQLPLARAQYAGVGDEHAVDLAHAVKSGEEDGGEDPDDGERDLRPAVVADGNDEDRTEHDAGHRVQGLDVRSEYVREQTHPAERDAEDDS